MFTAIDQVNVFMERGGDVLFALLLVIFLLWLFILERIVFFSFTYHPQLAQAVGEWESRKERTSWHAHQVRDDLTSQVRMALETNMTTIKMLVGLCPLFGLLGTVTGMIEVFDIMAFLGSGSPKAMASGISKQRYRRWPGWLVRLPVFSLCRYYSVISSVKKLSLKIK